MTGEVVFFKDTKVIKEFLVMKKKKGKRRLKVGRLILVIVLGIGLALGTYFGIRYLLKSNNNDKPINKPSEEEKEKVYTQVL